MRRLLLVLPAALLLTGCRDPRAEANIAQAMIDMGTQFSALQQDLGLLQSQVDSLRTIVARQDTMIVRLAAAANVPIPPR
jgi:hypothetical protein